MAQKLCDEYFNLSTLERIQFIGSLNHIVMTNPDMFKLGNDMINIALLKGLLTDVKILPDSDTIYNKNE